MPQQQTEENLLTEIARLRAENEALEAEVLRLGRVADRWIAKAGQYHEENRMLQIAVNEWAERATGLKNDLDEIAEEIRELES
jgi:uncharacterized coiled-coil DUF342 family protein